MLRPLPLMAIAIIIYNGIALLTQLPMETDLFRLTLPSTALWHVTLSDALLVIGLILLFLEIVSSSNVRGSIVNHSLALLVFIVCVVEFLLVRACGTSTFLLLTLFTLVDVVAGFSVTVLAARRDVVVDSGLDH